MPVGYATRKEMVLGKVRVWDLPTRLFHWLLVALVVALVVSGEIGGAAMDWHMRFGYVVLSLLLFRVVWGFVGGHWSRFRSFVATPRTVIQYVQTGGTPLQSIGHNPLGALSVLGLLGLLLLQVASGLFSDDEIATAGPLAHWASSAWVSLATTYHTKIGKVLLIVLVQLHIAAILYYRLRKGENLVKPMVTGDKDLEFETPASQDHGRSRLLALVVWMVCGAVVAALVMGSA